MYTSIFFNVFRNLFGNDKMMAEEIAENTCDFVAIGGNGPTHKLGTVFMHDSIWGPRNALISLT